MVNYNVRQTSLRHLTKDHSVSKFFEVPHSHNNVEIMSQDSTLYWGWGWGGGSQDKVDHL